jgi:prephenate dehydratase
VVFTLDQFADRQSLYPDLSVCAEIYLDVHHCLLGQIPPAPLVPNMTTNVIPPFQKRDAASPTISGHSTPTPSHPVPEHPRSKPLTSLSHIQRVYSHPQAWGQCTRFMNAYLRGVETIDVSSTSRAAELVKTDMSGTSAAVSSAIAADLLGLDFLGRNIEDREDNTTRFFVLRKGTGKDGSSIPGLTACLPKSPRGAAQPEPASEEQDQVSRKRKSLVSFTVPHTAPGALADVLDCFRKSGLNLTSINSRPSLIEPFQYLFFVEFEGHKFVDPEGRVKEVLERVGEVAASWRWLGSWENMRA